MGPSGWNGKSGGEEELVGGCRAHSGREFCEYVCVCLCVVLSVCRVMCGLRVLSLSLSGSMWARVGAGAGVCEPLISLA